MTERTMSDNAIVIERTFAASVARIWQMWTDPEHFKQWYGPQGASVPVAEMDVRVGGKRVVCMQFTTPDGPMQMWTGGEFTEIVPNERLVYTESQTDENGNILDPAEMGMPEGTPATTTVTVELHDLDGSTRMVMTHAGVPTNQEGANAGWNGAFDKLVAYLDEVQDEG